jgi:hypothetical protein
MHLLYVTDLTVSTADTAPEVVPYDLLVEHAAEWLGRGKSAAIDTTSLGQGGEAALADGKDGSARRATWTVLSAKSTRLLLIEVRQEVVPGVELSTRVTIANLDDTTTLRVGIARESQRGGELTPVGYTPVFQPGIIGAVSRDERLTLRVGAQSVENRYVQLPSPQLVNEFADILYGQRRLPVLLVHTRTQAGWNFARETAKRLIGMVRVVTLANYTRGRLAALRPHLEVPAGGARLVWSDAHVPGPTWAEEKIGATDSIELAGSVMRAVAPLSALYRGTDLAWQEARRRVQRAESDALATQVAEAISAADQSTLINTLQQQVNALTAERDEWEELANNYSADADSFRTMVERFDAAESEAKYWREQYAQAQASSPATETDLWAAVPALVAGVDPVATFDALVAAAEGHVIFTPAAAKSWSGISYPEPDDMLDKLKSLANAAVDLYSEDPGTIGRIDDWFKTRHGLNVSTADDTIQKTKALRYFELEGITYDQTPHVKVRDAVKPNQVGRIHFAMDSDNKRFVINHVALKLYGI